VAHGTAFWHENAKLTAIDVYRRLSAERRMSRRAFSSA
jgi:hypothetical protein